MCIDYSELKHQESLSKVYSYQQNKATRIMNHYKVSRVKPAMLAKLSTSLDQNSLSMSREQIAKEIEKV